MKLIPRLIQADTTVLEIVSIILRPRVWESLGAIASNDAFFRDVLIDYWYKKRGLIKAFDYSGISVITT